MRSRWFNILALVALLAGAFPIAASAAAYSTTYNAEEGPGEDSPTGQPGVAYVPPDWQVIDNLGSGGEWNSNDTFGVENRTNGSGLSMAAEAYGSGIAWDTELWSPPIDLSMSTAVTLTFESRFEDYAGNGDAWVDVSTDAGATWTNELYWTSDQGITFEEIDLTAYAPGNILVRWYYSCTDSISWYWHIDDVRVYDESGNLLVEDFEPPAAPDLSGSWKMANTSQILAGEDITYTVAISNSGNANAVSTTFVDPIPADTNFVYLVSPADATYNAGLNQIEWSGTVTAGEQVDVTFVVTTSDTLACGMLDNTATISDTEIPEPVEANYMVQIWDHIAWATDLELDDGGFVTDTTTANEWEWGTPTYPPGISAFSGNNVWGTDLDDDADDAIGYHRLVRTLTVPENAGFPVYLQWWDWNAAEAADERQVFVNETLVWNDGGDEDQQYWDVHMIDLSPWSGETVELAFVLEVCCGNPGPDGWYIDDISLTYCEPPAGIYVAPDSQTGLACPGSSASYDFTVYNFTGGTVDVDFTQLTGDGTLTFTPISVTVPHGYAGATFNVDHAIPEFYFDGDSDMANFQASSGMYTDDAFVETMAGNAWQEADSVMEPTLWPAYASDGTSIYYIDGKNDMGNPTDQVQVFTPGAGWTAMTHGLGEYYGGVAGVYGGNLYYAPGFDYEMKATDAFVIYDGTFNLATPMPEALGLGAGGVTDDSVFVWAGGSPGTGFISYTPVYTYDIATDTWYAGTSLMDVGLTAPGYAMVGDKLYVGGGYMGSEAFYVYDVSDDTWTQLADLPESLVVTGTATVSPLFLHTSGSLYVIGGGLSPTSASYDTWIYDISTDEWSFFSALNNATLGSGGGVVNGMLYTYGGGESVSAATSPAPHEYNLPACVYDDLTSVTGQVIDGITGLGLEGAQVEAMGVRSIADLGAPMPVAWTDASGYYTLTLAPAVYELMASYEDYDPKMETVTVTVAGATQDFVLGAAAVDTSPSMFDEMLYYNSKVTRTLVVTNTGFSSMDFSLLEFNGGYAPMAFDTFDRVYHGRVDDKDAVPNSDIAPSSLDVPSGIMAMGDELLRVDVGTPAGDTQILGVEYALDHYWLTGANNGGNPNKLYKIDTSGNLVATYDQTSTSAWGWRDLTFDGSYLYGSDSSELVQIDPMTGMPTGTTIPCPENPCRALAYDPATDHFWTANWSSDIYEFDRSGAVINSFSNSLAAYGMAWDSWSPGGPYLWVWSQDGTPEVLATQIDPISGTPTGVSFQGIDPGWADNMAGGAAIDPYLVPGKLAFIGAHQADSDHVVAYDLDVTISQAIPIPWLTESVTQTMLMPGEAVNIDLVFDATDVNALGTYTGNLRLEGGYMPITIPVQMTVEDNFTVVPDVLEATVDWGATDTDLVDLTNYGDVDVDYEVEIPSAPVLVEDFEGDFPPAGWEVIVNSGDGWKRNDTWGNDNTTPGSGYSADADSDARGTGGMDTELWSPPIDLQAATHAELFYANDFQDFGGAGDAWLDISTDDGATWTNLTYWTTNQGPTMENVDLTPYVGNVVRLRWHYDDNGGWAWWWQIDDVTVLADIPWLSAAPYTGTVATTDQVTFTYHADAVPQPGDYTTMAYILSDQIVDERPLSVTLHVMPSAEAARIEGTVTGNRTVDGDGMPLADVDVNVEGPAPVAMTTEDDGTYGLWFRPSETGTYTLTYALQDYQPYSEVVSLENGDMLVQNVELLLDSPYLNADPEAISEVLAWGATADQPVVISNPDPAQQPLTVKVSELSSTYTPVDVETAQVNIPAALSVTEAPVGAQTLAPSTMRPARTVEFDITNLALGKIKVLLVSSDWGYEGDLGGMDDILTSYPDLSVDIHPMDQEPTLEDLLAYDVVVIGNQYTWESSYNHNVLGDVMANYVDAGGGVVQAFGTMHGAPSSGGYYWGLGGRWKNEAYSPMIYSTYYNLYEDRSLGVYASGHPVMKDMTSITDHFVYGGDVAVRSDAEAVAYYDNGVPYVATYPGKIVALNQAIFLGNDWTGDVPTLLHNAILYVAPVDVPWLSEDTTEFNLDVAEAATMTVSLDAGAVDQPGTYKAWLWLDNNDQLQTGAYIPVEMVVKPDATMALLLGTVTSDRLGETMEGANVMMDMPSGMMTMTTDVDGQFVHWFMASDAGTYDVLGEMPGYVSNTMSVNIVSGMTTTLNMELKMDAPWLQYTAEPMSVILKAGEQMSRSLMVENFGQRDLDYRLMEFPAQNPALLDLANGRSGVMAPAAVGTDPTLYEQFEASPDGKVDFFIAFKDTADLTQAYYMMDWNERGQFVVNSLKAKAEQAQANVKAWLDTHDITYTSYWINNTLFVHAEKSVMDTLATFPEVSGFKANEVHKVFPIEATMLAPRERVIKPCYSQPSAPDAEVAYQADLYLADYAKRLESSPFAPAYPWNVMFPAADQVHTNFGVKGQGIVVGGMDTGVDYDHVGLVNNYRGYLGGSQFDHTYSWFDPQNNCGGIPCDTDGHGTATHGIMAGDDDPSLPDGAWIGMAPDAQWIHCVGCPGGSCPSSATTACAQWFLAPGGDPDMRPTVVNHSWGSWSPNSCTGSFMAELEAYRAADIFPAFAAGNVGDYVTPPHCFSSTPPANTVDANGNPLAFASGAHGSDGSLNYYSSGGPNACNNDKLFPDLASPGSGSCTTGLNSTYNCSFGGTSSASPHTAGCVALIRAANPTLSVAEVEQALRDAAIDVDDTGCGGTPDWNNKYGEGWLNCYGAVESVISLDIPWLSETPVTGTIAPQDQTDVTVTFDATDMEPGTYTGTLIIDHNDPMTDATELLVQLTVVENAGVVLEPMTTTLTGDPETVVTYTLHITNTGDMTETFNLTKDGDTWMTTVMPESVELASMESADILVTVMIPNVETLQLSACDTVTITAAGDLSPAMDDAMLTTCGIYDTGVMLEPMTATLTGDPEAVVTYTLYITNTGDATETFDLTKDDDTWMTTVMPNSIELASMESSEILVTVMIPGVDTLQISACDVVTVTATGDLTSAMDYSVLTTCGIPERKVYLPLVMRDS